MKFNSITLLILFTFLVGCSNGLRFSQKDSADKNGPGGECLNSSQPEFSAPPSLVEVGDLLNLNYPAEQIKWIIEEPDSNNVVLKGESSYTVSKLGQHKGKLEAIDKCNNLNVLYFNFEAFLPVGESRIIINGGDAYTSRGEVNLSLLSEGATKMYITENSSCSSGGSWQAYKAQKPHNLASDNYDANVYVKFANPVGNESACISDSIVHDDVNPSLVIASKPSLVTNDVAANFILDANDNFSGVDTYFCQLDNGQVKVCNDQPSFSNLNDGQHRFSVRVSDKAGNLSDWKQYSWTIDTVAPSLLWTQVPSSPINSGDVTFGFKADDIGSGIDSYECSLNQAAFQPCSSPLSINVQDGQNEMRVRANDLAGNVSATISHQWIVDTKGPDIQITNAPANPTNKDFADFEFQVSDAISVVSQVSCQLNQASPQACSNSVSYQGLADASHTFKIVAEDSLGNQSSKVYNWLVDTRTQNDEVEVPVVNGNVRDILFVLDTSFPDSNFLHYLPGEMRRFMDEVEGIDFQIGITSNCANSAATPGKGGTLAPFSYANRKHVLTPGDSSRALYKGLLDLPSIGGCNQPIGMARKAIENPENKKLFRDESHWDIVIITYKDELSGMKNLPDENDPDKFVEYMANNHPNKSYNVHSLSIRPDIISGDRACYMTWGYGLYSKHIYRLTELTGGIGGSICGSFTTAGGTIDTWAEQLSGLGEDVIPANYVVDLKCEPENGVVNVTYDPQPNPAVNYEVRGEKVIFTPYPEAGTKIKLNYRCKLN